MVITIHQANDSDLYVGRVYKVYSQHYLYVYSELTEALSVIESEMKSYRSVLI